MKYLSEITSVQAADRGDLFHSNRILKILLDVGEGFLDIEIPECAALAETHGAGGAHEKIDKQVQVADQVKGGFLFKLAIVTTIVVNVVSLLLALCLNSKIRAKSFFRGAYFLPNVLGSLVVGYIFNYFFTYILPAIGSMIGVEALSTSILSRTGTAWIGIMIVCAWQSVAMNTIIFIITACPAASSASRAPTRWSSSLSSWSFL